MGNRLLVFGVLLIIGIVLYVVWMFFAQRQVMYMSLLLYRQGDADRYLEELDSLSSRLFFNKKLRTLMAIDANLIKGDKEQLNKLFERAAAYKLSSSDRVLVLQKELLFRIAQEENEKAVESYDAIHKAYDKLTDKQKEKYTEIIKEVEYPYTIHVMRDGKYASELMERGDTITDPVPAGVCYLRAAQSYCLKDDQDRAERALNHADKKLKDTTYFQEIQKLIQTKNYKGILKYKI